MSTAVFAFDPKAFVGRFSVLVDEKALISSGLAPNNGAGPTVAAGTRVTLTAANYVMNFAFAMSAHSPNVVVLTVSPNALPGSKRCYFLPWCPDGATEMVLGNAAPFFFTSTLTGCSVKAHGPRATPTVIHANAKGTYAGAYATSSKAAPAHLDDKSTHAIAEAHATIQAQASIDTMLGAVVAGQGVVRKTDYVGQATLPNIKAAKKTFDAGAGYKVKKLVPDLYNGLKLQSGGFVYGVLKPTGWEFYYQASIVVTGKAVKKGLFESGSKPLISEEVVLGPPTQIF
jgi:hypothetical protein